jgi:hypothetical protein
VWNDHEADCPLCREEYDADFVALMCAAAATTGPRETLEEVRALLRSRDPGNHSQGGAAD